MTKHNFSCNLLQKTYSELMNANDFTVIDAQCSLSELTKLDPRECVEMESGFISVEWQETENFPND